MSEHGTSVGRLELGPVGIALDVLPGDEHLNQAAELEHLGYRTLWLPGGQIDDLSQISKIICATTTVRVGAAILSVDRYRPEIVAAFYAEMQGAAPDRLVVGLGGPQQPKPLQVMAEYLTSLDTIDPPVPAARRMLAALGPRKLELARDRCAGAIPLLVTPEYTASARQILGGESDLVIDQMVVLDTTAARARETARGPLRFLSTVSGYPANFARMGLSAGDISGLSDRLVDALIAWGDIDSIVDRITSHLQAGADQVVVTVLTQDPQPGMMDVARGLAAHLPLWSSSS